MDLHKNCIRCGLGIKIRSNRDFKIRKFCSSTCLYKYKIEKRPIILCECCGKEFTALKCHNRRFCGLSCKSKVIKNFKTAHDKKRGSRIIKPKICKCCNVEYYTYQKQQKYCSNKCKGIAIQGKVTWNNGRTHSEETKKLLSKIAIKSGKNPPILKGRNHPFWKGGVTPINDKIRKSQEYVNWRKSVYIRDKYTCQICGQVGGKLNADHIKPFSDNIDKRFDINNGRTLCVECHRKTDTYGWNYYNIYLKKTNH